MDSVVLFEKAMFPELYSTFDNENCRMTLTADGEMQFQIQGSGEVKCGINWKPNGKLRQTFDTKDFAYVKVTVRIEGSTKTTGADGKVQDQRPKNPGFSVALFDEAGKVVGEANLAEAAPDSKTPEVRTEVSLPMVMFTAVGELDSSKVAGVGFFGKAATSNTNRDYRIIIEKIALAH